MKSRVNIHDPLRESLQKNRRQDTHEPCQYHEVHRMETKDLDHLAIEILSPGKFSVLNDKGRDMVFSGPFQGESTGIVTDDDLDLRVETSAVDPIDNGLEIGTIARNENSQIDLLHALHK